MHCDKRPDQTRPDPNSKRRPLTLFLFSCLLKVFCFFSVLVSHGMEVAACQSALASCYSALEFGGIAVSAASPLAASHPNLPLFAAPSSPPPSVASSSLPSAVKSTLPFTALSSLPSAEISTPPPLTPTQSTLQRIRFHNHGQECSSMFPEHMVFKFCSVLLNGFN